MRGEIHSILGLDDEEREEALDQYADDELDWQKWEDGEQ